MNSAAKRVIDAATAVVGLILVSPVLGVVGLLVRLNLGSPVLFHQQRPGLHAKAFTILKFRTMREARDAEGKPLPDAERMTRFGSFLRRMSLDELPTLWNVVKGDMSLVGPRPLLVEYLPLYTPEQARRHEVRPGITGWAQVKGRNELPWDERLSFDVWYVDNLTLWLDLKILTMTVSKVLKREGISQPGQVTMEPFRGSRHG